MADVGVDDPFAIPFLVRWRDVDANGHVGHTVYSLFALEARFAVFERQGWVPVPAEDTTGVILREEITYRRELLLGERFVVRLSVSGWTEDRSRWRVTHEMEKANGKIAATVVTDAAFFSIAQRRIIAPPDRAALFDEWPRAENFTILPRGASVG